MLIERVMSRTRENYFSLVRDMTSHRPLSRKDRPPEARKSNKNTANTQQVMFFKLYFHFNAFLAENRRLFLIEFQLHSNTHITFWLTVVPTLDRHSCVARASEIPVDSFRRSSTNKEK